ncbi:hypothetical protein JCM3770_001567 [Rhodotorula araucariae]
MAATPSPAAPEPQRLNPTRPENLAASTKRASKAQLLVQYQQLLPLKPVPDSYTNSLRSALRLGHLAPPHIDAVWDALTQTVWVRDDAHMMQLWRQGFFGKGVLSRSEPSWRRRVENRRADLDGRDKRLTAEEVTALRRIERKGTKLAKKLERDAERLLAASAAASALGSPAPSASALPDLALEGVADVKGKGKEVAPEEAREDDEADEQDPPPPLWQLDAEHSQLQPEEAFFLIFALNSLRLTVSDPFADPPAFASSSPRLSILAAFRLFLLSAYPSLPPALASPPSGVDPRLARLDSPFLLAYAAYHHFRSMGWVVRSGVKFCVDWVLYGQGGPVGGHAEFAVLVLPTYVDPADAASNPFRSHSALAVHQQGGADGELEHLQGEGERRNSWRWFHTVNRVCSGVKKTLVLLHVVIPPLSTLPSADPEWVSRNPAQALAMLEMREVVVRRFLAGRMRD